MASYQSQLPSFGSHDQNFDDANGKFGCRYCSNTYEQKSRLRKHLKRHTRPYGCTFSEDNCFKRLGSRDDWKRHESTQHLISPTWRCALAPLQASQHITDCGLLFNRQDLFIKHITDHHGHVAHPDPALDPFVQACYIGRHGHHNFWCGFCKTLVMIPEDQKNSPWDFRLRHIGDHIDVSGDRIRDWICIKTRCPLQQLAGGQGHWAAADKCADETLDSGDYGSDGDDDDGMASSVPWWEPEQSS